MNKLIKRMMPLAFFAILLCSSIVVQAKSTDVIANGVFVESVDVSGMTKNQAIEAVNIFLEEIKTQEIVINVIEEEAVNVSAGDFGIKWDNPEIIEEAIALGKTGNIIKRYKEKKDLEKEQKVYHLEIDLEKEKTLQILTELCEPFNQEVIEATMEKVDGEFVIVEGQRGIFVSVEDSYAVINRYLTSDWDFNTAGVVKVVTDIKEPKGNKEELSKVQDLIGSYGTSFNSSANRTGNIRSASYYINGTILYPGEEFSANDIMKYPYSIEDGYFPAGSYLDGRTVDSMGGGVCQVSTTLYNAVLKAELEVVERNNHSMTVSYVPLSADAMIAGGYLDFKFKNNSEAPIYIESYVTNDKRLDFNIYGLETRPDNRVVTYVSETVQRIDPGPEVIIADPSLQVGVSDVQSARIGYVAKLWKVVTVDGVEISRTQVNKSTYKSVTRTARIGVTSPDPAAVNEITMAINTGVIDHAVGISNAWAAAIAAQNAATIAAQNAAAAQTPLPVAPPEE